MRLQKWTRPSSYFGAEWPEYYVFLGQNRDSDALVRSNFRTGLARLGGGTGEDDNGVSMVTIVSENHWACGWVEWIAIHESNAEAIAKANEMLESIEDYPVLDESDFSELEDEECKQTWLNCFDPKERIEYFRRHSYTASSLGDLLQAIRKGSWYHATNMLHCPNDLIS